MPLTDPIEKSRVRLLEERYVEGAGFANRPGGKCRPDATAWAILALEAAGGESEVGTKARRWLASVQLEDGRVCIAPQLTDACWPTALAVLAWQGAPDCEEARSRAVQFLLDFRQAEIAKGLETSEGHDETIPGWPWIAKTHAWVEPTAYALMALQVSGYASHSRARDAVRLLLNRQLADGGWNCGNTVTFDRQMRPMPESTGLSLQALAGLAPKAAVEKSIAYLRAELASLTAPMSLAWAILGLHAWQERLEQPHEQIRRVLARQEESGPYDTVSLSLLLLASYCPAGLIRFLEHADSQDRQ